MPSSSPSSWVLVVCSGSSTRPPSPDPSGPGAPSKGRGRPWRESKPLPVLVLRRDRGHARYRTARGVRDRRGRSRRRSRARRCVHGRASANSTTIGQAAGAAGARLVRPRRGRRLGFAIATLARSQLAGVGVGIAVYFGEQFATIFLPDVVKYLPFHAATAVVATAGGDGEFGGGAQLARLDPNSALLVVAAWLLIALVVTALFTGAPRSPARRALQRRGRRRDARHRARDRPALRRPDGIETTRSRRGDARLPFARRDSAAGTPRGASGAGAVPVTLRCDRVGREGADDRHESFGQGEAGHHPARPGRELVDEEQPTQATDQAQPRVDRRSAAIVPLVGGASASTPATSGSAAAASAISPGVTVTPEPSG